MIEVSFLGYMFVLFFIPIAISIILFISSIVYLVVYKKLSPRVYLYTMLDVILGTLFTLLMPISPNLTGLLILIHCTIMIILMGGLMSFFLKKYLNCTSIAAHIIFGLLAASLFYIPGIVAIIISVS